MTRWFYVGILLTLAAFAVSTYVGIYRYDELPERLPTHWNIEGQPDAWTPKDRIAFTFFMLPGAMVLILGLTLVLPWLSPEQFKLDTFRNTYGYIMMLVIALMAYMHVVILLASLGHDEYLTRLLFGGIFLFFALMGNVLGKVRRNFWLGVRTPWTLASERVWNETHRLAAWLYTAGGVIGFVAMLVGANFVACFVGLMIVAFAPVVYSLVLYKRLQKQGLLETAPSISRSDAT